MVKAKEAEEVAQADDLLEQVRNLQTHALDILGHAEESGDLRTALAAISQARGNLGLLGKLAGELALAFGLLFDRTLRMLELYEAAKGEGVRS
jgi:hypothetical protein